MDNFYRAFEDKFRGPRELIQTRLHVYLPFVTPLCEHLDSVSAVDLGCGRGEWLELLGEHGFDIQGADLDEGMLEACHERGLTVYHREAVEFLKDLPDAGQTVVSGFHIVEHIPFADVQSLVSEALRVLQPGGLLILETPNPENLVVGTSSFYLDPTHQRPIPPDLLAFVPEYAGFARTKILRLQESESLLTGDISTLMAVLDGVSPDYAVVAQKKGPKSLMRAVDPAFAADYGVTLNSLASRYQQKKDIQSAEQEGRAVAAEARAQAQEERAVAAEARAGEQEGRAVAAEARAQAQEERAVAAEARAGEQEGRAVAAEARAQAQEERAIAAEARAGEQEGRAVAAEARAQAQEERAIAAEARAGEQEGRAVAAEVRAMAQEERAIAAEARAGEQEGRAIAAEAWGQSEQARAVAAEAHARHLEGEINLARQSMAGMQIQLDAITHQAHDWHDQILRLQHTFSWRVTSSLRFIKRLLLAMLRGAKYLVKGLLLGLLGLLSLPFLPLLLILIPYVLARPTLRNRLGQRIKHYPKLRHALRLSAFKLGLIPHDPRRENGAAPIQAVIPVKARIGEQVSRAITAKALAQAQEDRATAAEAWRRSEQGRAEAAQARTQTHEERAVAAEASAGEQEGRAVAVVELIESGPASGSLEAVQQHSPSLDHLTPRAREIYHQLVDACNARQRV